MKYIIAAGTLILPLTAHAQTVATGAIDGLPYQTLTSPDGCSTANPCQIVTYLHYLGGESQTPSDLQKYFNTSAFWAANPHTIIVAPMINGSSDTNNWGGVQGGMSPNMQAAIDLVKQTETTIPTNPNTVVVTGGSMGGIGTEAAMVEAGPKGTVNPGVFASGLAYDGALYNSDAQAAASALCGVNFTMVHGTADTTVPYQYDQTLAGSLSGCSGFNFVPVQGATHGTWNYGPWNGYEAGSLIDQTLATARQGSGSAAQVTVATASTPAATSSTQTPDSSTGIPSTAASLQNDPTPGSGSATDCSGNVWSVNANNKILENGVPVVGGGDTSNLMIQGCTVYGKSNGQNGSSTSWFTMNATDPTHTDGWTVSAAPGPATTASSAQQNRPTTSAASAPTVCGSGVPSGAFKVVGGRIIGPDGKDWIARGINVADNDLGAADQMIQMFPGLNFVRLAVYKYQDPSAYAGFINTMTARGTVVEIEHHVETDGATGGGGQGDIASGGWLAQESAFYAAVAAAFKNNPYVWFGTTNEPPGGAGGSLSIWQKATYDAIRGTGNTSIVLLEIMGWPGAWNNAMDPSIYAQMTNVVWDPHFYGWISRYSTDQAAINQALADEIAQTQQIKSADGVMPVVVAEYGPSTTGQSLDANGMQSVDAVINSGGAGKFGSAVWHWGMQDCCNNLNSGMNPTDLGQRVQLYINTSVQPCSTAEATTNANATLAAVTAQVAGTPQTATTTPASAAAAPAVDTTVDTMNQAADASIAQANAIIAQAQAQAQAAPATSQ